MIQLVGLRGNGTANVGVNGRKLLAKSLAWLLSNAPGVIQEIPQNDQHNIFYTMAAHQGADTENKIVRFGKTFLWQEAIAFDVDYIDNGKHQEYIEAVCPVLDLKPVECTIVSSGGGLHFIIFVDPLIKEVSYFTENKAHFNAICAKINQRLAELGLPGKADPVVFEPARILRLPGTINRKPGRPDSICRLINLSTTPRPYSLSKISGLGDLEVDNVPLREVKRIYPNPDLKEMLSEKGCLFMRRTLEKPEEVHEPQAFDFFSIMAQVPDSALTAHAGKNLTPRGLSEWVFTNATSSSSLHSALFDAKWDQACRYGVRKCETISTRFDECHNCPHYGKILTPLDLKGPKHIGTKEQGFWVFNKSGNYVHPHYGDLRRHFENSFSYVSDQGFVLTFDGKAYQPYPEEQVNAWVERTMTPSDPVKSLHRAEAFKKILAENVLSEEAREHLFTGSIQGKINFDNGVLDVVTGDFSPHNPRFGFRYVLPYSYDPDAISIYFMDWLATVTKNRPELMDVLIDFMGYCLLPNYDDHCLLYMIGEGANGKSTFQRIIMGMLGEKNVSAININQLTSHRFMTSLLDGKLANISGESSGRELTSEQLNVIKALSSGETIVAERKGENGFEFRNKAKLIFSANNPPRFEETNDSIKRRFITVPFDHKISLSERDDRVGQRLSSTEIPGIVAMLIRHIKEKLKASGGIYKISRGEETGARAQRKLLLEGSSTGQWVDERLDISVRYGEAFITTEELYADYRRWCEESGFVKFANKVHFMRKVLEFVPVDTKTDRVMLSGEQKRVVRYIKWKGRNNV